MVRRIMILIMIMIISSISLAGCSNNEQQGESIMADIAGEILANIAVDVADSYIRDLQYRYPISDEFREQQIDIIITKDVENILGI